MRPDKLTIHDVFEKERRYVIPLYQRSYVWNQEEQWEPLWDDIRQQAERCLDDDSQRGGTHFLGAVVWSNSPIVGRSVAKADVIDGQQRLTTIQICLAALRDYAREIGADIAEQAGRWTTNPVRDKASEEALKVWPTNADRKVFSEVMRAGSAAAVKERFAATSGAAASLPRMAEAYLYFDGAIREFADEGASSDEREERLHAIGLAMRTALQFVVIELEPGDDPQIIFETLNARGQPLLPSDLIRNYVFLQASGTEGIDADSLYDKYWRTFDDRREASPDEEGEDRFWHIQERQGRLTRPRIDLFIFHYLTMHTERELNIGQLFREFRDWRGTQASSIESFLADLQAHGARFSELIAPTGTDRLAVFARRLKSLDTSTVYPLLLFLSSLPSAGLPRSELEQVVVDLESFLIRRFVGGLTNKNYNKFFLGLLVKAKRAAATGEPVAAAVRDELLRSAEKSAVWPSDAEFRKAWLTNPLYVKSRVDRAAMMLRAIEDVLRTSKNEALPLPVALTVEHLLPQKGSLSDYPFGEPMPIEADETSERCRSRVVHTIGNLTLLTQSLNAAVSNGPFPAKRKQIASNSDLRLNAWLRDDERPAWSETDIVKRGETLFERALAIWPKPAAIN